MINRGYDNINFIFLRKENKFMIPYQYKINIYMYYF